MKRQRKIKYELNQRYILQLGILTDTEYKQAIYDLGIEFLLELFDEDESWFYQFSTDPLYWKWWMMEWRNHENNIVAMIKIYRWRLTRPTWYKTMKELVYKQQTDKGFQQYIKTTKNVRVPKVTRERDQQLEKAY